MEELIDETLELASKKFANFGFKEQQIEQLLASGRRDLEKELSKLKILIEEENVNIENVNHSLHALKGLLYNMGNTGAGDIMNDLRSEKDSTEEIAEIKKILHL